MDGMNNNANMNHMRPRCCESNLGWKHNGLHEMAILRMNSKLFHLKSDNLLMDSNEYRKLQFDDSHMFYMCP